MTRYGHTCQPELYGPIAPIVHMEDFRRDCPACEALRAQGCAVSRPCPKPVVAAALCTNGDAIPLCAATAKAMKAQGWDVVEVGA